MRARWSAWGSIPVHAAKSVSPVSKGARSHKAFASSTKPTTRRCDDVAFVKNLSKHIPAGLAREAHPHIGCVFAAIHLQSSMPYSAEGCLEVG